jgi:hypothetical protein
VRFAPPLKHIGKSGAYRVGYAYFRTADAIYVLGMIVKSKQPNFTAAEKAGFKADVARIAKTFEQR